VAVRGHGDEPAVGAVEVHEVLRAEDLDATMPLSEANGCGPRVGDRLDRLEVGHREPVEGAVRREVGPSRRHGWEVEREPR
jgi:hypothetical protein